jgi:hypothetical protein
MIVALLALYLVILFILVKTKIVPFNLFWKCSPLIVLLLLMFRLFIPMGWGAPQGPSLVVRNSVQIVPNVAGEVTEVPVEPNKPLKAGDVLFRIDPVPYEAQAKAIEAHLSLMIETLDLILEKTIGMLFKQDPTRRAEYGSKLDELRIMKAGGMVIGMAGASTKLVITVVGTEGEE